LKNFLKKILPKSFLSKRLISTLSLSAALALPSTAAFAEIREIKTMAEILPAVTADSAVVFDLDNTVMAPLQTIGSDQFFGYLKQEAVSHGMPADQAQKWALQQVTPIAPVVRERPVETSTPRLISALQAKGVPVIALTARPPEWAQGTLRQLNSLGVDFQATAFRPGQETRGPLGSYTRGIIFMNVGLQKGPVLLAFLKSLRPNIKSLIFVDDRLPNITSMEEALKGFPITNINFRYGALDALVAAFSPAIAGTEWKCFQTSRRIVSDVWAQRINSGEATCESSR
jgi:hypothetical protein